MAGADVIAAASSAKKLGLAEKYGARHCINYSDCSLKESVKEITEGRGVDVIYDPVGGALFDDCLRSIAWKGRILVIGFAGGEIQSVPANLVLLKGSSIVGVFWGKFTEREPEVNRRNTMALLEMHSAGQITPYISDEFALQDAAGALKTIKERRALGKIIVKISL